MGAAMNPTMNKSWAVVLAAGGTRLRPLTRMLYGEDLPKQFAPGRVFESLRGAPSGERLLLRLENSRNTGTALSESAPEHDVQRGRAVALPA